MRAWLVLLCLAVSVSSPARADDREPVILLVTRERGTLVRRLRAELESMGFRVVIQPHADERPEGTVAVGRLAAGPPPTLDIETIGDTQPRQSVVFHDVASEIGSVRMAERVRAAFQPLAPRRAEAVVVTPPVPHPPTPLSSPPLEAPALTRPPPAPPRVAPTPPPAERRLPMGLSIGPALTVDMASVGMHAAVSYHVSPIARLRLEPFLLVPLVPTSRAGPEGEARLYGGMLGALVNGVALESRGYQLAIGGGLSGVWLRVEGEPAPGYVAQTDDAFAASLIADVVSRIHIHEDFFITPRAYLGIALPLVNVELSGRSVNRWGLPWFVLALAAELDWAL